MNKNVTALIIVGMMLASVMLVAGAVPRAEASVSNYAITDIKLTSKDTIVVTAGCIFCAYCNPNDAGSPGCTPFACGYPPSSFPSYADCNYGYPVGRYAAIRITGTFGTLTQKLVCTPSNWPIGTSFSHNFIFTGVKIKPGETIKVEADFYCDWCYHWYATPRDFVPNKYTIVFVPLNWQGDLSSFNSEADAQANFLIDNLDVLTSENTEAVKVSQNLALTFDKSTDGWKTFNEWDDITDFANDNGATGERYVAITNEDIWDSVEGLSNLGPVVVVEAGSTHVTAHELGHTWGLLDEYNPTYWQSQKDSEYPTNTPPNSYPGDDTELASQPVVKSYGRAYDTKRCIMGSADTTTIGGSPITRGYCPAHTQNSINYVGCSAHTDDRITQEWSSPSTGLVKTVVTFYRNGTLHIEEINGVAAFGRPMQCYGPQNYSLQVYSENGILLYDSNVTGSFWLLPSQSVGGTAEPFQTDFVTVDWLAPAFSETLVTVNLKDNVADQVVAVENVTVPRVAEAWMDYVVAEATDYLMGDTVQVTTEVNTSMSSMNVILDASLLDSHGNVQGYTFWAGTIYPTEDPISLFLNIPSVCICGEWTVYTVVLNETGQNLGSESTMINVGILGDVDCNWQVDMGDIVALVTHFGEHDGQPGYDPYCDIVYNNQIDMGDIVTGVMNFGRHFW